jgi:hypothetical protein
MGAVVPLAFADEAGVVQPAQGMTAEAVKSLPEWDGTSGRFVSGASPGVPYIYHLTGGEAQALDCGTTDPHPTNNMYVTSTAPLSVRQLEEVQGIYRSKRPSQPPASVTGISNGCPTPGVAGQPGEPNSPPAPRVAAVTVRPSNRVVLGPKAEVTEGPRSRD